LTETDPLVIINVVFVPGRTRRWQMAAVKEHYIVDGNGKRISVLLSVKDYKKMLNELEELESIRAYDRAKRSGDDAIPFEQAVHE